MVVKKFLDIPLLKRHRHILIPHYREGSPQTCGFKDKGELGAGKTKQYGSQGQATPVHKVSRPASK